MTAYQRPTARQREVILAVLEAGSVDAAAQLLGITPGAAGSQLATARKRCGVRSTEQMIVLGVRDGWISHTETFARSASEG